jgi:O-antigen ligase
MAHPLQILIFIITLVEGATGYGATFRLEWRLIMKKSKALLLAILISFTLSACAGTSTMAKNEPIKCPACGYEFSAPAGG